jgi:hypothetical protein
MSPSTLRVESSLAIALASAVLAVVDSSAAAQAQPAAPQAASRADVFLGDLQRAVEGRDRRAVASMVQYPINVLVSGLQVPIRDTATMVKTYDAVFTPDLENMIAQSGVPRTGQPAPAYPIRTTPDGMVLGGGFVWIQRVGSGFKIFRITVPPTASVRALRHEPTRVTFPNGVTAQLSGLLVRRDEVQTYLLRAQQGQSLQVSITGFRGRDAVVRVFDDQKRPVDGRARGDRSWAAQLPATADYRIDVVRTAPDADPSLIYVLSVTLR